MGSGDGARSRALLRWQSSRCTRYRPSPGIVLHPLFTFFRLPSPLLYSMSFGFVLMVRILRLSWGMISEPCMQVLFSFIVIAYSHPDQHRDTRMSSMERLVIQCSTCNRPVPYSPVKTNGNGNQGRLLAKVDRGKSYFCWLTFPYKSNLNSLLARKVILPKRSERKVTSSKLI